MFIKSFAVDGQVQQQPVFPADMTGNHTVEIVMADSFRNDMLTTVVGDVWYKNALCG